jgi:hypothetical protein
MSAIELLVPSAVPALKNLPFLRALGHANPYFTIVIGIMWALIASGLLQMREWGRWAAQVLLAIGVAWAMPMMLTSRVHSPWRILATFVEIALRIAAICYLLTPAVLDAFTTKRSERLSLTSSGPDC